MENFCDGLGKKRSPRPKRQPPPPCPKLQWSECDLGYEAESHAVPGHFYKLAAMNNGIWTLIEDEALGLSYEQSECGHVRLSHETVKAARAECKRKEYEAWDMMLAAQEISRMRRELGR